MDWQRRRSDLEGVLAREKLRVAADGPPPGVGGREERAVYEGTVTERAEPARRDDLGVLRVLGAADVEAMDWEPLRDLPGVGHKVLWQSGEVVIGLVRVEAGHEKPAHEHYSAHHHIWVVSGSCTMIGRPLAAGSYVYVPPGVSHEVADVGPEGCVYFYTHRPLEKESLMVAQIAGAAGVE
jgi:mannose-6-phosphate isomerase-like protein (cupin superfamily)